MTATKGFIHAAATTALDTRKADEAKVVADAAGVPRVGVLTESPSIVTSDASTAPMRVAVAKAGFVTRRATGDGVAFWGNDGTVFVTVTPPASNSHYVVVWAKHNDSAAGDASSLPEIGSTTGAAAASPVVPFIPAGALALANVLIPSTATSTTSAGVVITNRYPMTAMRGGVVQLRNATEQAAWTPADGGLAYRIDAGQVVAYLATAATPGWYQVGGKASSNALQFAGIYSAGSPTPRALVSNGWVDLSGVVVSTSASFVVGTQYHIGSVNAALAPAENRRFACTSNVTAVAEVVVDVDGLIRIRLNTAFTGALSLSLDGCRWQHKGV